MAGHRSFEDLEAWKRAYELTREVYRLTSEGDIARDFGLRDRLRKASVAVIASIAQGHEQQADTGFLPFLGHAKGSLAEVKTLLLLARDLEYLAPDAYERARGVAEEAAGMVGGLYAYLKKSANGTGKKEEKDPAPPPPASPDRKEKRAQG